MSFQLESPKLLQWLVSHEHTAYLLFFDTFNSNDLCPCYQNDVNQINLNQTTLYKYLRSSFKFCTFWFFPWTKLFWHSCSMRDKLGWLNWFWQFLSEGLSSFNLKGFYYSYAWSCSLCEGRTFFYMILILRKFCGFLCMFLTPFTLFIAASCSNRQLIHTNLNQRMYLQVTMIQMLHKYRVILIIGDMIYCKVGYIVWTM